MAQRIIKLNESDITRMVMNVLNEVAGGYSDDEYEEDEYDLSNFPDLDLGQMEKEFHGQGEENEFTNKDDDADEYVDDEQAESETDDYSEEDEESEEENDNTEKSDDEDNKPIVPDTDPEDEKPHQDGDVVMYENIPITYKDGKWHMTIEDGFESGDNKCPRIDVVASKIKDVKDQYDFLWDSISYREHGNYAKSLIDRNEAEYQLDFSNLSVGGDNTPDLATTPILIDVDKKYK